MRQNLNKRSDLHPLRKIWHCLTVLTMFLVYHYSPPLVALAALIVAMLLFVPIDLMRQTRPKLNAWVLHHLGPLIRESEAQQLAGTTYLIAGVALVYFLFPRPVVELSLLFLAFGDPVASTCGILFGRDRTLNGKTLQGTYGALTTCTLVAGLYFYFADLMTERIYLVSLLAGLVGGIAELIPIRKLDDNLTFPVLSALGLTVIFYLFGGI